jgi:DNA-binding NtrC family response regulator
VAAGAFREDLYFRLNVLAITLPPLRDRRGDVAELVGHFLDRLAVTYGKPSMALSDEALAWLTAHDLPGNVRQLENLLHRGILRAESARIELADTLKRPPRGRGRTPAAGSPGRRACAGPRRRRRSPN